MQKYNQKPNLLILLSISIFLAGCSKSELLELKAGNDDAVIEYTFEDIGLKFCLLNEDSIPSTSFREGENFRLQFVIENHDDESLEFTDYGFYQLDDFFAVKSGTKNYGKPYKFIGLSKEKVTRFIFPNSYTAIIVPWHDDREEFSAMFGYFEGLEKAYLEKGEYYTQFTYRFKLGEVTTPKLTFRINFEIN